ncbi:MAG: lipoyl(octanoyl) transferase LipB [Bacteroidota bacterium]|nr:lipoyl(octanoyl) transferase LipB [Bacteroidota bacterium]
MKQTVLFKDLRWQQSYKEIWDLQESIMQENAQIKAAARGLISDERKGSPTDQSTINHLLFVEHAPVYTLGKSGDISNVLISESEREHKGIEFFKINRGGDITFHGPGQLVGYPILDLEKFKTDLGWYLRCLEEVIILTIAEYGLRGVRSKGETGVWIDPGIAGRERKICAMGIRCSRWITMHGFAFNVNTNLDYFTYIIPCGIKNKQVTSLQKELGYTVPMEEVKQKVRSNFEKVFEVEMKA